MKTVTLLFFILCFCSNLFAQNPELDSINFQKILFFKSTNNDSLIYYSIKAENSNDLCLKYNAKICEAKGHYQKGNYEIAEQISLIVLYDLKFSNNFCQKKIKLVP